MFILYKRRLVSIGGSSMPDGVKRMLTAVIIIISIQSPISNKVQ